MASIPTILNRDRKEADAAIYLITFVVMELGFRVSGVVNRRHNRFGSRLPEPNARQEQQPIERMHQLSYELDGQRRGIVLGSPRKVCLHRNWTLLAAHVRTKHVHVIVTADPKPEHVMNAIKAYAGRALNREGLDEPSRRRWARHGSTRYLWTRAAVSAAIQYVVEEQGASMAVFKLELAR